MTNKKADADTFGNDKQKKQQPEQPQIPVGMTTQLHALQEKETHLLEDEKKPVGDSVAKAGGSVAVGEDLAFQRRWWKFERGVWIVFALILLADLSGLLGRGPLSKKEEHAADGSLLVKYESVERANTPSIMTVLPGAAAIQNGALRLFVSDSMVDKLGTQRVIPSPVLSTIGNGGVTYTFPATSLPMTVQFALQPSFIGSHAFRVGVAGQDPIQGKIVVLP